MFKVFYSWQSDLPNRVNRSLIQSSLGKACTRVKSEGGVLAEAVVERDTLGLAGAPSINDAILAKIRDADAFVADVSLINADPSTFAPHGRLRNYASAAVERISSRLGGRPARVRPTPNPNVLVELGYAMAQLGNEELVLVMNTHYGAVDLLPFDLRQLRTLPYRAGPGDDIPAVKKDLEKRLANAIKEIGGVVRGDPVDTILYERTKRVAGQARGVFFELARAANVVEPSVTEAELIDRFESVTSEQLGAICEKINPNDQTRSLVGPDGSYPTWLECLKDWRQRSASITAEILVFSPFLRREHAALLMRVEYAFYFKLLGFFGSKVGNRDLTWISGELWKYFQAALALQRYGERELARRAGPF